jgi:hypothetical protein
MYYAASTHYHIYKYITFLSIVKGAVENRALFAACLGSRSMAEREGRTFVRPMLSCFMRLLRI